MIPPCRREVALLGQLPHQIKPNEHSAGSVALRLKQENRTRRYPLRRVRSGRGCEAEGERMVKDLLLYAERKWHAAAIPRA